MDNSNDPSEPVAAQNTDPPPTRCWQCKSRLKYDGYWAVCRENCGSGSYHDPRHKKLINRFRLWFGM